MSLIHTLDEPQNDKRSNFNLSLFFVITKNRGFTTPHQYGRRGASMFYYSQIIKKASGLSYYSVDFEAAKSQNKLAASNDEKSDKQTEIKPKADDKQSPSRRPANSKQDSSYKG